MKKVEKQNSYEFLQYKLNHDNDRLIKTFTLKSHMIIDNKINPCNHKPNTFPKLQTKTKL
jgi:hypothetical protein